MKHRWLVPVAALIATAGLAFAGASTVLANVPQSKPLAGTTSSLITKADHRHGHHHCRRHCWHDHHGHHRCREVCGHHR